MAYGTHGPSREYFLRFLRFLRNDLSVKTSDGISWLGQAKDAPARSKSSSKLPSFCSTQRHNGAPRQTLPYYGERNPCVAGNPVSHHQSPSTKYARTAASCSCASSVIRARRSQCGVPQLALRAYEDDALEDRGGALPRLVERGYPTKPIITIPTSIYGYGNGDDAEEAGPERRRDGREHGERKADKARRCSRLVRPLGDRRRDIPQLHPGAAFLSPRAPGSRKACAGRSPHAALAENAARVFTTSAFSTLL
jgi:hypothetical protein